MFVPFACAHTLRVAFLTVAWTVLPSRFPKEWTETDATYITFVWGAYECLTVGFYGLVHVERWLSRHFGQVHNGAPAPDRVGDVLLDGVAAIMVSHSCALALFDMLWIAFYVPLFSAGVDTHSTATPIYMVTYFGLWAISKLVKVVRYFYRRCSAPPSYSSSERRAAPEGVNLVQTAREITILHALFALPWPTVAVATGPTTPTASRGEAAMGPSHERRAVYL